MNMSLAEFKRRIRPGQQVTVVSYIHPHLSGERTVEKVQTRNLLTRAKDNGVWTAGWPKASQVRIEGDTLHFLDDTAPDGVAFSYTFHFDQKDATATAAPIEIVVYRDPDGDTELSFFANGVHLPPRELGITVFTVDPSRHAPEEEEEWVEETKKDIAKASPAAAARIREASGLDEEEETE